MDFLLPSSIDKFLKGKNLKEEKIGLSASSVLSTEDKNYFLKIESKDIPSQQIQKEKRVMEWLYSFKFDYQFPKLILFEEDEKNLYLLMSGVKGINFVDFCKRKRKIFLSNLHFILHFIFKSFFYIFFHFFLLIFFLRLEKRQKN